MSAFLWKSYLEDDFDTFRQLLDAAQAGGGSSRTATAPGFSAGSPGRPLGGGSPTLKAKAKPHSRPATGKSKQSQGRALTRADINSKDMHGVTILHLIASSNLEAAASYASALLGSPLLDLYVQDHESGWTALHRALYCGNVAIARELMERDIRDFTSSGGATHAGGLIKIKDHEGNSPFDVYALTIAPRLIPHLSNEALLSAGSDDEDEDDGRGAMRGNGEDLVDTSIGIDGEELFTFGSNKNLTLGFSDEDDRQFPERVAFRRPEHLLQVFREDHLKTFSPGPFVPSGGQREVPAYVRYKPMRIHDVQLSKLHTAVLTTDPEANLYLCGFGPGGRLGTGDQGTRFTLTSILGGGLQTRKVVAVGLGQDHTLAVTSTGEVFSWGSDRFGQLGYSVTPSDQRDDDPIQLLPRQLFGPLKREIIKGCAASRLHSVVFTSTSLFTFGKNDGQLGLVDSDARLLEKQIIPRRVAASLFSGGITMVTAIDKATACLLDNHDVWIFANYGYRKVNFHLSNPSAFIRDSFSAVNREDGPNYIVKICGGGDTICALARTGEVFSTTVSQKVDTAIETPSSTTNPSKIRGGLSSPQQVWALRKDHMMATDIDVGQDGSFILCTRSGSVWRKVKRAKIKDSTSMARDASERKTADYKFSRIPGLTEICAVRANAFGTFAAVRRDTDVLKEQIRVSPSTLWRDMFPLLSFADMRTTNDSAVPKHALSVRAGEQPGLIACAETIQRAVLTSTDIETDITNFFDRHGPSRSSDYDVKIGSTVSDVRLPCHQFVLMGRSEQLRRALLNFKEAYFAEVPEVLTIEYDKEGIASVIFQGLDIFSLLNIVLYLYTDSIIGVWNNTRRAPHFGPRFRQVRIEVMKTAAALDLRGLERAARLMTDPIKSIQTDFDFALSIPEFLHSGDIEVQLEDGTMRLHSAFVCQRCPFFEGLFHGRASGGWLESRRRDQEDDDDVIQVDLDHVTRSTFEFVVRYFYGDVEDSLFSDCAQSDFDEFLDVVLDVLAVANELMIDRLAQICQKTLGRYANMRSICWLLNAVSPCSVSEFKNAALEYICLDLEGMLENRLLDELDADLVVELGKAIQANQLACLPIGRSDHEEMRLLEEYPALIELIDKERQKKIDYMALHSHFLEDEVKMAKISRSTIPRASSTQDLMFEMEEEGAESHTRGTGKVPPRTPSRGDHEQRYGDTGSPLSSLPREGDWFDANGKPLSVSIGSSVPGSTSPSARRLSLGQPALSTSQEPEHGPAWALPSLQTGKLGMKEIMAQASEKQGSNISAALASAKLATTPVKSSPFAKVSQKERKRQLQAQKAATTVASPEVVGAAASPETSRPSPWRVPSAGPTVSLQEELSKPRDSVQEKRRVSGSPSLTMRQTLPGNAIATKNAAHGGRPSASAAPSQRRAVSSPAVTQTKAEALALPSAKPAPISSTTTSSQSTPLVPKSIRHILPPSLAEPSENVPLADILAQQQIEKQIRRDATAKRSLQEIQEEQAFQEWWNQEEAATKARMEQEAAAAARASSSRGASRGKGPGSGSKRGKEGGRGGRASAASADARGGSSTTASRAPAAPTDAGGPEVASRGSRGRSRGGGGHRRGSVHKPIAADKGTA